MIKKATIVGICLATLLIVVAFSNGQSGSPAGGSVEAIAPLDAPFAMPEPSRPSIPERRFDIRMFDASEGGASKNTRAIQRAIDSAANTGGGVVVVPPGTWLTGALHLQNNINLHLEKGATLLFSQDSSDYLPAVFSRHEDIECYKYSAFIYANGKTNIAITGEGTLDGQGKRWWGYKVSAKNAEALLYRMGAEGVPVRQRVFDGTNGRVLRPAFFQPMSCTNVLVEGVTFMYGAFWTITPTYCENVIVRRVHIVTEGAYGHTPNGDGIDPSSCRNVLIEYCTFDTGDDCIAIKSGRDSDGLRVNKPTENVVVRHCRGLRGHGGIVIGSETSGGVRNVYGLDCSFSGTDRIVRIKTARGRGGVLENFWFTHLSADSIEHEAIRLNMLYTGSRFPEQPVSSSTPRMRNIHLSDISCTFAKRYAVELIGLPEMPIENVTFDRITMRASQGISCTDVRHLRFSGIAVTPSAAPLVRMIDAADVVLDSVAVPPEIRPLVRVEGPESKSIRIQHSQFPASAGAISLGAGVMPDAVVIER